jgi:formate hydrogenlyase transcriptional activator
VSFRVRNAEGEYQWFLSRAEPVRAANGTVLYWIGVNFDIDQQKRAEQELRDIFETVPALIWVAQPDGSNAYVNNRYAEYSGMGAAQAAGSGWREAVHRDDLERHAGKWRASVASGAPHESEVRFRRADGQYRWHLDRGLPLLDAEGNIIKWYGVVTDIDDHKRAEEALRRSEHCLAEAQRLSHTGSFGWNVSTDEHFWSDETFRIFEFDPSSRVSLPRILERVHPQDMPAVNVAIARAASGEGIDLEIRLLMPDGRIKHLHVVGKAERDQTGTSEIIGAVMDITERRVAEEAIRRSEAYLAEAQKLSHTGSFGWRPDSGEIVWSEETYRIFEYDSALTPTVDSVVQRVHPSERAFVQQVIDRATQTGTDIENEYRLLLTDGRVKYVHAIAHAIQNASGNREFIGAVTDITERKTTEDKIRRLVETDILGVFIANVEGEITEANKAFLRMLQYSRQDLVSGRLRWRDLTPVELRERDERTLTEALASGSFQPYEKEFLRKDGSRLPVLIGGALFQSAKDGVVFVLDLSEQKRAAETIRGREAELRQMLDLGPQIIGVLVSPGRERLHANRFALAYYGVSLEEWRKRSFLTEVHPDDFDRVKALVERSAAHPGDYEVEMRLRKGDGTYRWFLVRFNPLRDDQGQLMRWYLACTDIDDRRRAEERLQQENLALREEVDKASMFEEIVGTSPALQAVLSRISKVAPTDSTALITGETGTGKELVARAIHRRSNRASRAFISVSCAAIPRELIASELFGHEKGAFTGAMQRRLGRFELADGGTIFLDEVGELSPDTQVALLRVLQERELERVGGGQSIRIDVRVVAATNRDLKAAVANGTFREDLYYRLNVFPLEMPPLRVRKADIPLLVEYFIDRYARKAGKNIRGVDKKTLQLLQSYPWPGNIRELQNVIERSVIVCETEIFTIDESWLSQPPLGTRSGNAPVLSEKVAATEKEIIEEALRECQGRVFGATGAAAKLGIARSTLESKIRSLNINKNRFKAATGA